MNLVGFRSPHMANGARSAGRETSVHALGESGVAYGRSVVVRLHLVHVGGDIRHDRHDHRLALELARNPAAERAAHDLLELVRVFRARHHRVAQLLDDLVTHLLELAFVFSNGVEVHLRSGDHLGRVRVDDGEA